MKKQTVSKSIATRRLTALAVLSALSLITFMIESLFPPLFVVGAKMGLSNIFVLFAIVVLDVPSAVIIVIVKCALGSLIVGNMSTFIYSIAAGLVSVGVSAVLISFVFPKISIVSISVVGAVIHNMVQNCVFVLIGNSPLMFSYLPYLALVGILSGIVVGFGTYLIVKTFPQRTINNLYAMAEE